MEPAAPPSGGPSSGGPFSAFKFGLDPLFWAFAKLSVKRLLSLAPFELVPNVLSFCGRPIHRAQVMGVVVDATEGDGRKSMRVDDGTGVVPCIAWDSEMRAIHGARWHEMLWPRGGALGCLVTVFGEIGEFRGERQLKVQSLHVLDDPNAEALFYAEMDQLTRTVYMQPPPKPPAPPKRNLCWDFQKGRCAQGSMCTFLHEGGGGGAAAAATPADDAVYSAVRAFLSAREEFAYAQLTQDADVGAAARSSGARPEYLTRAIHRLVDQGEIYLRDPHADTYTTIPPLLWIPQVIPAVQSSCIFL